MPARRQPAALRGSRVGGGRRDDHAVDYAGAPVGRAAGTVRTGAAARRPPASIDYQLARRALLAEYRAGAVRRQDVCDAHPYLLRAARFHGEDSTTGCPVCSGVQPLTHVRYVYGDSLGPASGRPRSSGEITSLARAHRDLDVYTVEVCQRCGWNHLVTHTTGSAVSGPATRRSRSTGSSPARTADGAADLHAVPSGTPPTSAPPASAAPTTAAPTTAAPTTAAPTSVPAGAGRRRPSAASQPPGSDPRHRSDLPDLDA